MSALISPSATHSCPGVRFISPGSSVNVCPKLWRTFKSNWATLGWSSQLTSCNFATNWLYKHYHLEEKRQIIPCVGCLEWNHQYYRKVGRKLIRRAIKRHTISWLLWVVKEEICFTKVQFVSIHSHIHEGKINIIRISRQGVGSAF